MKTAAVTKLAFLAAALALSGCLEGAAPKDGGTAAATAPKPVRLVDRDVEAPAVFQVTDTALWDGRPSLGGVWVASPDTVDPERVIMRNPANGKSVIGALFKRERDNPGPTLQISSDAAEALGLLAGQPAAIEVTALRREEVAEEPAAAPADEPAPGMVDDGDTAIAAAVADAATDVAATDAPVADAAAVPAATAAAAPETVKASKPSSLFGGRKAARAKAGADIAAEPAATPMDTAAIATAALDAVDSTPLDATAPAAAPAPAPEPAPAPAAAGGRPIQIGFFSVEANADRAVRKLADAGVTAEARKESSQGKDYWSVIARGDAALLKKIKDAGFADAYLLK